MEDNTDYSQYADDVKGQANLTVGQMFGQESQRPKSIEELNMSLGFNPSAHLEPTEQYVKARAQMASEQRKASKEGQNADFRINDARFYAGIGDFSAVESIMKSKGPALFQIGENIDFEDEDERGNKSQFSFLASPKGNYSVPDGNGGSASIPAMAIAKRMGVRSVAFKGGDMKAQEFRTLAGRVQRFYALSNQLKRIYKNNIYLGSLDPSNDSAMARAIESNLKMDYLSIMKDMRGMGGNVSDNDMAIAESMVPQRASNAFFRLGGNEMSILDSTRENVLLKLKEVAGNNGLDLIDTRMDAKRRALMQSTVQRR